IQMLPKFCFPFDMERYENLTVQHFTFALTDMEGKQRFGFCRLAIGFHSCLCILSYLPWFEIFYKILNYIADNLAKKQVRMEMLGPFQSLRSFPSALIHFRQGNEFIIHFCLHFLPTVHRTRSAYFIVPSHGKLPTIPESRNLTEFVVAVDVNNMLHLYASLLRERRILLSSSKLSTLTACVQAASSMLYPMHWQHIFIPVLPPHLLDYCW
uniref:UDENN domain-containing protein n=1 Tax=Salvator merianae TaxID=96440 RepID=A0A8D0DUF3_SALMN